ncbi:dihydroxyacetone kinase-like protein [Rhodopseudomonas julia]|uniref:Dihydroxyacetone kinase-like protein n=1 Tax=Rhodopseudomonas julia TaxID=200617 RepID=A0ABU0C8V2_9BRAD|nr:dihydroxyacetone kinase subunit DhaK [Rhodopseudomonas julia]MDQ0326331.1 dihydroxyacetone kinase-like protein [Rhodopseudomonas julia]
MKKLINNAEDVTLEQLKGFGLAHPEIEVHFDPNYVAVAGGVQNRVAVVSGGGAGHEPLHGGYVGMGMLDAACPGQTFTSPTPDQMYEAGKAVNGGKGILQIIKNYTGDVLNFRMAADLLRDEGIEVRNVVIDDDVALKDSLYTAGRRGLGTTVIAEKVCGAASQEGYDLNQLAALCKKVNIHGKSMGMALTPCTTPQNGTPSFELADDEMEIGIGIHGEPGTERMPIKSADEITEILATRILEDGAYTRELTEWDPEKGDWVDVEVKDITFQSGDEAIAIVNSMGATPISELYTVYAKLAEVAEKHGVKIVRKLVGHYITSLEMAGVSITLVKADEEILRLYDAPVNTPALRWGV